MRRASALRRVAGPTDEEFQEGLAVRQLARLFRHHRGLIAATVGLSILASLGLLAFSPPVYRATARLRLDDELPEGGLLDGLALLARPPAALSEIEVLRSRTIAERTVDGRSDGTLAPPADAEEHRHLGLTTLVEDCALAPLAFLRSESRRPPSDDSRLCAAVESAPEEGPRAVRMEFLSAARVRLSSASWYHRIPFASGRSVEHDLRPGEPLEWQGLVLRLETRGDLTGRSFLIRTLEPARAVERVMERSHVHETSRNSGVIELSFDDSDPVRASDTANALCLNYLERCAARGERRALRTLGFIESQLQTQTRALDAAAEEVVRLQKQDPETIDVSRTAEELIRAHTELEVERMRLGLSRTALQEALELLQAGRIESLSRLSTELADPLSLAYVEQIAALTAEAELQDRSDTGAYKTLLQTQQAELQAHAEALEVEVAVQRQTLADVEDGNEEALSRLGVETPDGGDPLGAAYLDQLAELRTKLAGEQQLYTEVHPEVVALRGQIAEIRARLLDLAKSRLAGLLERQQEYRALLASYEERLALVPSRERTKISAALEQIRVRIREHLAGRLEGLTAREADLVLAITGIEGRLGDLPESERVVAGPRRRLEAHTEIVKFLLGRQQEAELVRAVAVAPAEFIDPAIPPTERHSPSVPLRLALGAVLGLFLGVSLAFVRQSLDAGIITAAELESASGLPVFGVIPDFRHGRLRVRNAGERFIAMRDAPEGSIAEAYRSLRANLKFALAASPPIHAGADASIKTMAFTSCLPGEGKSVTGINLALAFATSPKRVLFVDTDMRRPSVQRYLGLPLSPGLAEILSGRIAWTRCLHRDGGLDVITAGKQSAAPGDLLAGERMDEFLAAVRGCYDLILFDLPAALAVADTESFASKLDAMVLLCRGRRLTRAVVRRAADRLRNAGANLIGSVLNAGRPHWTETRYGYDQEYGSRGRLASQRAVANRES